jgi:hypothetical protein
MTLGSQGAYQTGKVTPHQKKSQLTLYPGDVEEVRSLQIIMMR